jgi:hypothetical protein
MAISIIGRRRVVYNGVAGAHCAAEAPGTETRCSQCDDPIRLASRFTQARSVIKLIEFGYKLPAPTGRVFDIDCQNHEAKS